MEFLLEFKLFYIFSASCVMCTFVIELLYFLYNMLYSSIQFFVTRNRARIRSPEIDSKESIPPTYVAFYRTGTPGFNRLAESILWNRFLGSLNVYKCGLKVGMILKYSI